MNTGNVIVFCRINDGLGVLSDKKVLIDSNSKYWTNFAWNGTNLIRANGDAVPEDYPISVVEGKGFTSLHFHIFCFSVTGTHVWIFILYAYNASDLEISHIF